MHARARRRRPAPGRAGPATRAASRSSRARGPSASVVERREARVRRGRRASAGSAASSSAARCSSATTRPPPAGGGRRGEPAARGGAGARRARAARGASATPGPPGVGAERAGPVGESQPAIWRRRPGASGSGTITTASAAGGGRRPRPAPSRRASRAAIASDDLLARARPRRWRTAPARRLGSAARRSAGHERGDRARQRPAGGRGGRVRIASCGGGGVLHEQAHEPPAAALASRRRRPTAPRRSPRRTRPRARRCRRRSPRRARRSRPAARPRGHAGLDEAPPGQPGADAVGGRAARRGCGRRGYSPRPRFDVGLARLAAVVAVGSAIRSTKRLERDLDAERARPGRTRPPSRARSRAPRARSRRSISSASAGQHGAQDRRRVGRDRREGPGAASAICHEATRTSRVERPGTRKIAAALAGRTMQAP